MPTNPSTSSEIESAVYCITCTSNGKVYIGSAVCIRKRWWSHRDDLARGRHHSRHLQQAWNKYGAAAFAFDILEAVDDPAELLEREQFHIDRTKAYDRHYGYNINPTAGSNLGRTWSEATREKKIRGMTGRKASAETKTKMAAAKLGKKRKPFSEEHKANLSAAKKCRPPRKRKPSKTQNVFKFGV
jgi:group I intron endonuclease